MQGKESKNNFSFSPSVMQLDLYSQTRFYTL